MSSVDHLTDALLSAVTKTAPEYWKGSNKPETTLPWEKDSFIGENIILRGERACSSGNWCTLAAATALYMGRSYARGWWLQYFEEAMIRHQGKEPLSRIYMNWIFLPVCAVLVWAIETGDVVLKLAAIRWLRAFWAMIALSTHKAPSKNQFFNTRTWGSVTMTAAGSRSFSRLKENGVRTGHPHHLDYHSMNVIIPFVFGMNNTPPSKTLNDGKGNPSWSAKVIDALVKSVGSNRAWAGLSDDDAKLLRDVVEYDGKGFETLIFSDRWLKDFGTAGSFRFIRTAQGVATLLESTSGISNATAAIYGCVTNGNGVQYWIAPDIGFRPSANNNYVGSGTVTVHPSGKITTTRSPEVDPRLRYLQLDTEGHIPPGQLVYDIQLNSTGVVNLLDPVFHHEEDDGEQDNPIVGDDQNQEEDDSDDDGFDLEKELRDLAERLPKWRKSAEDAVEFLTKAEELMAADHSITKSGIQPDPPYSVI